MECLEALANIRPAGESVTSRTIDSLAEGNSSLRTDTHAKVPIVSYIMSACALLAGATAIGSFDNSDYFGVALFGLLTGTLSAVALFKYYRANFPRKQ